MDIPGAKATPVSTVGRGRRVLRRAARPPGATGFYPPAIAAALPDAVEEAARAVERWGAL
jgi:hypothetical protein